MRRGLTIIEMLVAMVVTLILLFAVVRVFEILGDGIHQSRASIEMSSQLRAVIHRLEQDFEMLTVPTLPWLKSGTGYLEVIEGPLYDQYSHGAEVTGSDGKPVWVDASTQYVESWVSGGRYLASDTDDMLAFTIASKGDPYVAKIGSQLVESHVAEVVWWVGSNDMNGDGEVGVNEITLNRRVIPVRKDMGRLLSLEDLSDRRRRYAHGASAPFEIDPSVLASTPLSADSQGEDVALANLLSFDVQVFDPEILIRNHDPVGRNETNWVTAGDSLYGEATDYPIEVKGGYIDLGRTELAAYYGADAEGGLAYGPHTKGGYTWTRKTWDTWPYLYEIDGQDIFNVGAVDRGADGLDNDGVNGVDDAEEAETTPPYPFPLRGLQVRIRVLEPSTKQVRQATVPISFVPE
jgi:hypothetical protein